MFKQMKDLGLIFTEDENGLCRLTLIGEKLVRGEISLVEAMRLQLQRYQYPSATSWSGSGAIEVSEYVDRGQKILEIKSSKRDRIERFIEPNPKFIQHPEFQEIYQRSYWRGTSAKDLRNFDSTRQTSKREVIESKIQREYVLLTLKTPITKISSEIVQTISENIGIDERLVEKFLRKNYSDGSVDDFFAMYRELARMGTSGARDFEKATREIFQKIFGMKSKHIGAIGNTPDVFVESENFCGIIDNKAYRNGYSISGDHRRVMEDVYLLNYKIYGNTNLPLAFFIYIADSFGRNIDSQLQKIHRDTGINGSAISVEVFVELAQIYSKLKLDHEILRRLFSLNREILTSDLDYIHQ